MSRDYMCAVWCNACSKGDRQACAGVNNEPQCRKSCPPWLQKMGTLYPTSDNSITNAVEAFKSQYEESGRESDSSSDVRDRKVTAYAKRRGEGREQMVPKQFGDFMNRSDVWGGGQRRMVQYGLGPRREDEHYYAPRYVPVGFAQYVSPVVNPMDYRFYRLSGWRIAVPRTVCGPNVRNLLLRIYKYGPQAAGYARLGDTLVPAILTPGDRRTLAGLDTRY